MGGFPLWLERDCQNKRMGLSAYAGNPVICLIELRWLYYKTVDLLGQIKIELQGFKNLAALGQ